MLAINNENEFELQKEKIKLYQKLLLVQKEMPRIDKDATVEFKDKFGRMHKYKHSKLEKVLSVLLPILNKHNLLHTNEQYKENDAWLVKVRLIDVETGLSIATTLPLLDTTTMQNMGSCNTYAMRYGILHLLGLAPEIDDEANKVSRDSEEKEKEKLQMQLDQLLMNDLPADDVINNVKKAQGNNYPSWELSHYRRSILYINNLLKGNNNE